MKALQVHKHLQRDELEVLAHMMSRPFSNWSRVQFIHSYVWTPTSCILSIECLHDAVHSHTRMLLRRSMVSFHYSAVCRKTTKHVIILDSLRFGISNFTQVCVLIFLSFGCSLVVYHLNKSSWTFCCVSHTKLWGVETNMAVASAMTCKISFIWRHMKIPYCLSLKLDLITYSRVGG